jgi:hypothetical protein
MESVAIWKRAPVAFAVAVFVVGAAVGFGVGYGVGHNGKSETTKAAAKPRTSTTVRGKATAAQQRFNQLLTCMAGQGVKWPSTPGGPKIGKPPPGVATAKYNQALNSCYGRTASPPKTNTTVPATRP